MAEVLDKVDWLLPQFLVGEAAVQALLASSVPLAVVVVETLSSKMRHKATH